MGMNKVLTVLLVFGLLARCGATDLIADGGFEDQINIVNVLCVATVFLGYCPLVEINHWEKSGTNFITLGLGDGIGDSNYLDLQTSGIFQEVSLVQDKTYDFQFSWAASTLSGPSCSLSGTRTVHVQIASTSHTYLDVQYIYDFDDHPGAPPVWTKESFSIAIAESESVTVSFDSLSPNNCGPAIDAISLVEIEPMVTCNDVCEYSFDSPLNRVPELTFEDGDTVLFVPGNTVRVDSLNFISDPTGERIPVTLVLDEGVAPGEYVLMESPSALNTEIFYLEEIQNTGNHCVVANEVVTIDNLYRYSVFIGDEACEPTEPTQIPGNLVQNGGFEIEPCSKADVCESGAQDWEIEGGNGNVTKFTHLPAYSGDYVMHLNGDGEVNLTQLIPVEKGKTYRFNFSYSANPYCGDGAKEFYVSIDSINLMSAAPIANYALLPLVTPWTTFNDSFTSDISGDAVLRFTSVNNSGCGPLIDAISVYKWETVDCLNTNCSIEVSDSDVFLNLELDNDDVLEMTLGTTLLVVTNCLTIQNDTTLRLNYHSLDDFADSQRVELIQANPECFQADFGTIQVRSEDSPDEESCMQATLDNSRGNVGVLLSKSSCTQSDGDGADGEGGGGDGDISALIGIIISAFVCLACIIVFIAVIIGLVIAGVKTEILRGKLQNIRET